MCFSQSQLKHCLKEPHLEKKTTKKKRVNEGKQTIPRNAAMLCSSQLLNLCQLQKEDPDVREDMDFELKIHILDLAFIKDRIPPLYYECFLLSVCMQLIFMYLRGL